MKILKRFPVVFLASLSYLYVFKIYEGVGLSIGIAVVALVHFIAIWSDER